jgi:serine phosphatase RsbU (regulator of sigma subunit)/anti-sigma regulatory factor (Ser/Thr protein kinase)
MPAPSELALRKGLEAVPCARRFVRGLTADGPDRYELELVVTELVTNAVLYGEPPMSLRVVPDVGRTRVEVADTGRTMPQTALPRTDSMTGRGLGLVATLAERWGVRRTKHGKAVWAELAHGPANRPAGATADDDVNALLDLWGGEPEPGAEPLWTVRLGAVPTDLLVDAKAHIDNVVRELTLAREDGRFAGAAATVAVAKLIDTVTNSFAEARAEIKRQAVAAARRGDAETDLVLHLPASTADAAEAYMAALDDTDLHARAARLLTLATPPAHRVFRHWYLTALVEQLRAQAAGLPAPLPRSFAQALAEEVSSLAHLRDAWDRLQLLEKVTGELTGASTVEEIGRAVSHNAVEMLGALVVWVYVLGDDGMLRVMSAHGGSPELCDRLDTFSLEEDYPACAVVRSRKAMVLRNRTEIDSTLPPLADAYPVERALHLVPLTVGARAVGCLALAFPGGSELEEAGEQSFLAALADAVAQALQRATAMEKLAAANERLSFLADASVALAASLDFQATADAVANLMVPRLADMCVLSVIEGDQLVPVALRHADPDQEQWALDMSRRFPTRVGKPVGPAQAVRTGASQLVAEVAPELLEQAAADDGHLAALQGVGMKSGLVVPLVGRAGAIGAMTLVHTNSGRRYRATDLAFVEEVARRASLALETARAFEVQSERLANVTSIAQVAQHAILAPPPARLGPVRLSARYSSATAEAQVGGDLYEVVERAGSARLLIGDVRGKGLAAVRTATVVLGEFRAAAADVDDLPAVAAQIDRRLRSYIEAEDFVTALIAEIGPDGSYRVVCCGHPPALLAHAGSLCAIEVDPGVPLGLGSLPRTSSGHLAPGDRLLLYTDGVIEARDVQGRFVPLDDVAQPVALAPFDHALDGVLAALRSAAGPQLGDDLALLLAEYTG